MKASLPMFPVTMLPAKEKTLPDVADEGNVSVILENTYSTSHVDNCKHSVAAFDEIFR